MLRATPGRQWPPEWSVGRDPVSGATVRQLTNYLAHSNHSYFTYPCWYDNGRKLVIYSDRENRGNLYGVDLENGALTQLTDWDPAVRGSNQHLCKNPVLEEIYYHLGNDLVALDLRTLKTRPIFTYPPRYNYGGTDVTADGRDVVTGASEDLSHRIKIDLGHGYIGFHELHAARPHSLICEASGSYLSLGKTSIGKTTSASVLAKITPRPPHSPAE